MSLFGGIGTLVGPLLGALVLESLQQYFTLQFSNGDLYLVIYGALFLAVLLWLPRGIIPTLGDWWNRWYRRHRSGDPAGGVQPLAEPAAGEHHAAVTGVAPNLVLSKHRP
jgi:branched-chain amino acid transport system permease protein